eukprot:145043-Pelagomonas_calceolata.AAC.1
MSAHANLHDAAACCSSRTSAAAAATARANSLPVCTEVRGHCTKAPFGDLRHHGGGPAAAGPAAAQGSAAALRRCANVQAFVPTLQLIGVSSRRQTVLLCSIGLPGKRRPGSNELSIKHMGLTSLQTISSGL